MDIDVLTENVQNLLEEGDEAVLRTFVVEHINEFPEDVRNEIALYLFEEAVTERADAMDATDAYMEDADEALETLGSLKRTLEEYVRLAAVRERLHMGSDSA